MRSTTVAPLGFDRKPFECRLRFHRPLRGVEVVPADEIPSTTRPTPPAPHLESEPRAKPTPAPTPAPTPVQPPTSAAPATLPAKTDDHWPLEMERELTLDRERIESVLREVRAGVANLRTDRDGRLQELQRVAVELALTIATRVLHERVEAEDFPIDAKIRDMIVQLGDDVPVAVRLNPADLELLKSRLGDQPLTDDRDDPRFIADAAPTRGSCQVEGRESMLMSDVSRELQEIRDELLRSLGNARS
jgi:hypothetical protein